MTEASKDYFIDEPAPFGSTLETWERHLALLEKLPDSVSTKAMSIERAKAAIAEKKQPNSPAQPHRGTN